MPARRRGNRGNRRCDADGTEPQPARPTRGVVRSAAGLKPTLEEVLEAVRSLYEDQMKPFGRILRKRLAEQAVIAAGQDARAVGVKLPDIDVQHLLSVCSACGELEVRPEEAGDWSAILVGVADPFIDIFGNDDPYSEEVWAEAAAYFGSLTKEDMQLPGGRYTCAQLLIDRDLPFLRGFSFGKVCHFIQIAISKRKILGYSDGSIVPWAHSMSMVKETRAAEAAAPESQEGCGLTLATWETARTSLKTLLSNPEAPNGRQAAYPLSNLKRLLRQRCEIELSETALGHSKLSDLLQDARFADVCRVELQGVGYVVVPAQVQADSEHEPEAPANDEDRWLAAALIETTQPRAEEDSDEEIDSDQHPGAPAAAARRTNFGVSLDEELPLGHTKSFPLATPLLSPGVPSSTYLRKWAQMGKDAPGPLARSTLEGPEPELQALCRRMQDTLSTPLRSPGTGFGWGHASTAANEVLERDRPVFCADQPLDFESAGMSPTECVGTPFPSPGIPTSTIQRNWGVLPLAAAVDPRPVIGGQDAKALGRLRPSEFSEPETAEGSASHRFGSGASSSSRSNPPTPETYTAAPGLLGKAMPMPTDAAGNVQRLGSSSSNTSNMSSSLCTSSTASSQQPSLLQAVSVLPSRPTFGCPPLSLEPDWNMFGISSSSLTPPPSWPSSAKSVGAGAYGSGLAKLNNNNNNAIGSTGGALAATPTGIPPGLTTVPPTPQSPLYMMANLRAF